MTAKIKSIITWLLAFAFTGSGITKLLGVEMQIKNLESWGYPLWFRFPIGLTEIALAVRLMIPRFRKITIYGIFVWSIAETILNRLLDWILPIAYYAFILTKLSAQSWTKHYF